MDFATAQEKIKSFTKKPSDDILLEFYGLYKQATVGDCSGSKPGMLDLKGKAKFEAWEKLKGMSADDAKAAYVKAYEKYAPQFA